MASSQYYSFASLASSQAATRASDSGMGDPSKEGGLESLQKLGMGQLGTLLGDKAAEVSALASKFGTVGEWQGTLRGSWLGGLGYGYGT